MKGEKRMCALHEPRVVICSCGYVEPDLYRRASRCEGWSEERLQGEWGFLSPTEKQQFRHDLTAYKETWGPEFASGDHLEGVRYALALALERGKG